jgi:D-alanine-D-alanine ligase
MSGDIAFVPTTVGIIFGGVGPEHGVSCLSARSIARTLEERGFNLLCIGVSTSGHWFFVSPEIVKNYSILGGTMPSVSASGESVTLHLDPKGPGFLVGATFMPCEVVFPIIHGIGGEDGRLQGLLETAGIAYVGSGVEASAICMNKVTAKRLVQSIGVETGSWISVNTREASGSPVFDSMSVWNHFGGSALFIKPVSGGSSAGISHVSTQDDLDEAFAAAMQFSDLLIVEKGVTKPRELEVAILETNGGVQASPVGEIRVHPEFEFYDFEAKYLSDGAELVTPAELEPALAEYIRSTAIEVFRTLGCRDYARVDFFLNENSQLIFNEINTVPGFTSISMYSRMWAAGGIDFPDLVCQLVGNAAARSTSTPDVDS